MSAKTKIVVFHLKEVIYTAVFAVLGILLILLLIFMFLPGSKDKNPSESEETIRYVAGVYNSSIKFNDKALDMEVVVSNDRIQSISLVNLDETAEAMYPLMQPTLDNLSSQIYEAQSLDNISYSEANQYTSAILLSAIEKALDKAKAEHAQ